MILVDLNQVLLSGLMAQIASQKGIKLEESLVRHMILNIIRTHVKNFRNEKRPEKNLIWIGISSLIC